MDKKIKNNNNNKTLERRKILENFSQFKSTYFLEKPTEIIEQVETNENEIDESDKSLFIISDEHSPPLEKSTRTSKSSLLNINNKQVNLDNINSMADGLSVSIENLLKILSIRNVSFPEMDVTNNNVTPFLKEAAQNMKNIYELYNALSTLRDKDDFCNNKADLLKYTCLQPMLIYLQLFFERCKQEYCYGNIINSVNEEFTKLNGKLMIETSCTDSNDVCYVNQPFSFTGLLNYCIKLTVGDKCDAQDIFEENFLVQQTLTFLRYNMDDAFCQIMQNIYNIFFLHLDSKIIGFVHGLKKFITEKAIVTWISNQLEELLSMQNVSEKNSDNKGFRQEDVVRFISEYKKINNYFDKYEGVYFCKVINLFSKMQGIMTNLVEAILENYYEKNYAALFETNMQTLVRLLEDSASCEAEGFVEDIHIIAIKHYMYRTVLRIIQRITFLENTKKQENEENSKLNQKSTHLPNHKNLSFSNNGHSVFAFKLDKDSFFYQFLTLVAKDSHSEALKEIINQAIGASIELIAKKYEWQHYTTFESDIFKISSKENLENKKEKSTAARIKRDSKSKSTWSLLKDNHAEHYSTLRNRLLESDKKVSVDKPIKPNGNDSNKKAPIKIPTKSINVNKKHSGKNNFPVKKEISRVVDKNKTIDKNIDLSNERRNDVMQKKEGGIIIEKIIQEGLIKNDELPLLEKTNEISNKSKGLEKQLMFVKLQLSEAQNKNKKLKDEKNQATEELGKSKEQLRLMSQNIQDVEDQEKLAFKESQELRQQVNLANKKINQYELDLQVEIKKKEEVEQELKDTCKSLESCKKKLIELGNTQKQNQGTIVYQSNKIDRLQEHINRPKQPCDIHNNGSYSGHNNPYKEYNQTAYGKNHNRVWNQPRNNNTQPTPKIEKKGDYATAPEHK